MNWIEKTPIFGDTVKFDYSNWYYKSTGKKNEIGVFLGNVGDRMKIDLGYRIIYLSIYSIIFVKQ
jgi:hypothetical protein